MSRERRRKEKGNAREHDDSVGWKKAWLVGVWGQTGDSVFLFYGTPGSRIWFLKDDDIANTLSIRFIATDRPGYGLSDQKKHRRVLDWAADIAELANF